MKALILAAGYGTRLEPLTNDRPKALLKLANKYLIDYILQELNKSREVDEIIIATNGKFFKQFHDWRLQFNYDKPISIISDGRLSKETGLGVVEELKFVLETKKINENLLVIASDNYFEFSIDEMISFFREENTSIVALCNVKEKDKIAKKFGVVELDKNTRIISFDEKPERPKSTLISTAFYLLKKEDLSEVSEYLKQENDKDSLGEFIRWLSKIKPVHGFVFTENWYDVGSHDQYEEVNLMLEKREALNIIVNNLMEGEKVVFVFGAGASLPSGMPSTEFLKKQLINKFVPFKGTDKFEKALKKLPKSYDDLADAYFEYLITLGCLIDSEDEMVKWLKRYFPDIYRSEISYYPSIAYEFVAHLMSNQLIKYVINLNYDEILDKTIEDELGEDKCYKVVALEDFERLTMVKEWSQYKKIFNIKPHGTISLPMSLRHRYEQVLEFEKPKQYVLRELIKDSILILLGYEMRDDDFKLIFNKELDNGNIKKVIIVKNNPMSILGNYEPYAENFIPYKGRSEEFFKDLAEELYKHDEYEKYYTKATRHFIRCMLYKKITPDSAQRKKQLSIILQNQPHFFKEFNLLLEILIFCFKTRGLFMNVALTSCLRIKTAIKDYLESLGTKGDFSINKILDLLVGTSDVDKMPLRKKEIQGSIGNYWYYIPKIEGIIELKDLYKENARRSLIILNNRYLRNVEELNHEKIEELAEKFYNLQHDFDYDLAQDDIPFIRFQQPKPVTSRRAFAEIDKKIFGIEPGALLYVTSATGEWLRKYKSEIKQFAEVKLLINKDILDIEDSVHSVHVQDFLLDLRSCCQNLKWKCIPDVRHHITMAFKEEKGSLKGQALYFRREGKASAFSPFILENERDIQSLKSFFEAAWNRADELNL